MTQQLMGLLPPPAGFVSSLPPLLGSQAVPLLDWDAIKELAQRGHMDGRTKYGSQFVEQQRKNNCAGASSKGIVAKTIFDTGRGKLLLSDTYTYSLINGGRDNGSMLADAMVSIERDGVCLASTCGPEAIYPRLYDRKVADAEAKRFRVRECYALRANGDLDDVKRAFFTALCLGFKVGVAVQAGSRFDRIDSDGVCGVDQGGGNHAVHCDGIAYAGGRLVATSENSWGDWWGSRGRMLLDWKHFAETIGVHEFYAARTAIDDPLSPNNPPPFRQ